MSSYQSDEAYPDENGADTFYHHAPSVTSPGAPTSEEWDPEALGNALLNDESSDWSAVTNLDTFFCKVYTYYVEKGFWCMVAARLTNLLTLAFTICFSSFLLLFVNWHALFFCDSNCDEVVGFRSGVFTNPSPLEIVVFLYFGIFSLYWFFNFLSFFYSLRDALEMRSFYKDDLNISDDDLVSLEWHYILESLVVVSAKKKLCIVKDLTALDITNRIMRKENYMISLINLDIFQLGPRDAHGRWNVGQVCFRECQKRSNHLFHSNTDAASVQEMTSHGSTQPKRLRERSNIESLPNSSPTKHMKNPLLQDGLTAPPPAHPSEYKSIGSPPNATGRAGPISNFTKNNESHLIAAWWPWAIMGTTLEWNLRFCVLNNLFDSHFYIHPSYLGSHGIQNLKTRFIIMGVANLILSPFIMLFMIIFFFLKHAEELHSKKSLFGPRQWCLLAQWKLREFNELPHFFERRLTLSSVAAQQYMQQFPNTLVSIIAQSVAYITGAIVAILLVLTVTDSDIISHRIFDRTLLWYLAIFSGILALSRSMIPDKSIFPAPALVMAEVMKHTHYLPLHWRGKTHTGLVHREFSYMYPSRFSMFCFEIMSVILTPFVLIFCLPQSAERIVQFVSTRTINVQGVGHLCSYAMFDLEKHGDTKYSHIIPQPNVLTPQSSTGSDKNSGGILPSNMHRQHSSGAPIPAFPLRLKNGKMEKSFLNFSMANPHWKPETKEDGGSGAKFLSNLADTMYYGGAAPTSPFPMSRDVSGNDISPQAKKVKSRFNPAASSKLPSSSPFMPRQDSLDSNTTDEEDFEREHIGEKSISEEHEQDETSKSSASYLLSQSDRHLIQSFADLVGMDPTIQSTLHPSTMMRQSSLGAAGSMVGMSTMLGLNSRRPHQQPQPPQRAASGNMNQSMLMRSHVMGGQSIAHPQNSVLFASTYGGRSSVGGLQGGLSASSLLQLDPQTMREQLMLAQADQQADLFALLEGRIDADDLQASTVEEGDEPQEEDEHTHAHSNHMHRRASHGHESVDYEVKSSEPTHHVMPHHAPPSMHVTSEFSQPQSAQMDARYNHTPNSATQPSFLQPQQQQHDVVDDNPPPDFFN